MRNSNSRLRVMYLIDFATSTGGAERFAIGLATHLPRDRFETWMCATRSSDLVASRALADAGVRHVVLGRRSHWDVHRLGQVARIVRGERIDVLHTHKFGSNLWGSLIGSACQVPAIVAHEHSWSYEGNPTRAWLDGHVIGRLADRFIAVSSADGARMVSREGVRPSKVTIIPNGYVPSPVHSDTDLRAELALHPSTPVVAIAAVLRPEKRLDLLLEAYAQASAQVPDVQLVIAGDGECRPALQRRAVELGCGETTHFLGARADVDGVLRCADIGAMCSDREGSPLFVFECMANETALVATAVGGIPDVVENERTGLLVPRRDPDALARALIRLLTDAPYRRRMARDAHERLQRYTIDVAAQRFAALYEGLAA